MAVDTIPHLERFLENIDGTKSGICDVQICRLTAPGDNYGSILHKLDVTLKNPDPKVLHLVAKSLPAHEKVREIFNVQVTFRNEMAFYSTIVPTLDNFLHENRMKRMDCFPKFYGGRRNLNGGNIVDDDAVILLENLKTAGYRSVDRQTGFDLELTKLILTDLAAFHGVSLALKLKKPELFAKNVRPYCHTYKPPPFPDCLLVLDTILGENEQCRPFIPKIKLWGQDVHARKIREPFATLCHQDLWINNMMQKYVNGRPVSNKFLDFQVIDYASPASDVFLLLFSSVQLSVLKKHLDYLLGFYHERLINILEDLRCDTTPFRFEKFKEELRLESGYEFHHAIFFSVFIVNIGKKNQEFDGNSGFDKDDLLPLVNQENRERAQYITLECARRGWLN